MASERFVYTIWSKDYKLITMMVLRTDDIFQLIELGSSYSSI